MIDFVKPLTKEDKEKNKPYHVGALFNLSLKDADAYFSSAEKPRIPAEWILNQGEYELANDMCGGVAASRVLSLLNKIHIGPFFLWMATRLRAGQDISEFGVSNRDLADTMRKLGALKFSDEPFTFKDGRDKIADPTNWNVTLYSKKAAEFITGKTIVWVEPTSGMDAFDTFRAAIAKLNTMYGKYHSAVFGFRFDYPLEASLLNEVKENGTGHDVMLFWPSGEHIEGIQSYGITAGDHGHINVSRTVFNRWAEEFGCFIPTDATEDEVKRAIALGGKLDDPWHQNLVAKILLKIKSLLPLLLTALKKENTGAIPSPLLKPALCWQESDVKPDAVGDLHLKNRAYGILQIRKPYIMDVAPYRSAQECLNNVQLSLDVFDKYMARYATEKRLGRQVTDQDIARIHNGGPDGYKKQPTLVYWYQVKNKMRMLQDGTAPEIIINRLKQHKLI